MTSFSATSVSGAGVPEPGSAEELRRFAQIQERLEPLARRLVSDPSTPQTVVVDPSLTLDSEELAKISGVHHYEERLLCMLMLLRMPRTNLVFVTSQPIAAPIVDYYLHLLPGVPYRHARGRLTLLSCHDASDVPLYGNDPELNYLGTKSGSREVFREAGIPLPDGFEHLRDAQDIAEAVVELKRSRPGLRRVAVKLDEGFSGEGNAVFNYEGAPEGGDLERWVRDELPKRIKFEAKDETWERYCHKFGEMRGIVECWV